MKIKNGAIDMECGGWRIHFWSEYGTARRAAPSEAVSRARRPPHSNGPVCKQWVSALGRAYSYIISQSLHSDIHARQAMTDTFAV